MVGDPRTRGEPLTRRDWLSIAWLGFIGYYLSSLVDFIGLQYVTAALERLMLYLYPTIVVVLSAIFFKQRITGRIVVALIAVVCRDPAGVRARSRARRRSRRALARWRAGVRGLVPLRLLPGRRRTGHRAAGSLRFIALAMLTSALFIFAHFLATRPLTALLLPVRIHLLSLTMAVFSTVLPTYLIAEAIKRIGANRTSLLGSMGPLFTIWLGSWLLDEPCIRSSWSVRRWFSLAWRW